jgi:glyoxylase-like metal-dependent hydrolase (beta-lactamase superfamily II)
MRTLPKLAVGGLAVGVFILVAIAKQGDKPVGDKPPEMKFNDVKEIAPGVFFRYSAISATDKTVVFGGSNEIWIVCKDHVVVIDGNFPKGAEETIEAIKKTTDKPIKYVLDTHHHGDHAYGNMVWSKVGAKIISSKNTSRLLKTSGPMAWESAAKDREDVKKSELKQVDDSFDEKLVLDDGTQVIEFHALGHSHTIGDTVAYLPKHKILCTGDACVNGAFNYMGHSNSASWITCLEKMQKFDIKLICPGHGPIATKDLLETQKRYFVELRKAVKEGIDAKKELADIVKSMDMPWYKEWTGVRVAEPQMNKDNVEHVYKELMGKIDHDRLGALPREGWPYAGGPDRVAGR